MRILYESDGGRKKGPRGCCNSPGSEKASGVSPPECTSTGILADTPQPMKVAAVELRELKALEIAARCRIECKEGTWLVPSQTSPATKYRVTLGDAVSCQCEDFQLRRLPCKHVIAARIVCERDHDGKPLEIDTTVIPKRKTYSQVWPV